MSTCKLLRGGLPLLIAMTLAVATAGAMQTPEKTPHSFAQKLVTSAQGRYADATEIGIEFPTANGCTTIASTDKGDVGETCESDDIKPLKTGRPSVAKESDGYDVAVLLHDATGHRVGVLGVEMKLAGHTRASALAEARKIEREMAAQISSRASLAAR